MGVTPEEIRRAFQALSVANRVRLEKCAQMRGLLDKANVPLALGALVVNGKGFGQEAVVHTFPVPATPQGGEYVLSEIEASDFQGGIKIGAVGQHGFLLVDLNQARIVYPQSTQVESFDGHVSSADGATILTWGTALDFGNVGGRDVAVVAGNADAGSGNQQSVVIIDLSDAANPLILGDVALPGTGAIVDVEIREGLAYVGRQSPNLAEGDVVVVQLGDGTSPTVAGTLKEVGGRLAFGDSGLLYSTVHTKLGTFGSTPELGGIRTATFAPLPVILPFRDTLATIVDAGGAPKLESRQALEANVHVYPSPPCQQ